MNIKEIRNTTGLSQRSFSKMFNIPISTLQKWEQGESSPTPYIIKLIANQLPIDNNNMCKIEDNNGKIYYYNRDAGYLIDSIGTKIQIGEDLNGVKEKNLSLYVADLFESYYEIVDKFNRDCRLDKTEDIIWFKYMAKRIAKEYYLMHKDIPVCLMELTEGGSLGNYRKNEAALAHFPIGGQMNDMKFHDWWKDRAIPKTRHGAKTALQRLGYSSTNSALVDNLALSLSDCYWIKPRGEDIEWKDVNLFTNDFVDTFGEITLNKDNLLDLRKKTKFNCAASQGELQKKWCIDTSGRRYMIKGNYGESYQQSINELFATELHRKQKFENFTVYTPTLLTVEGGIEGLGCLSYDFCSENLECISAWELLQSVKLKQNESYYYPLKKVCLGLGIKEEEFDYFMETMKKSL